MRRFGLLLAGALLLGCNTSNSGEPGDTKTPENVDESKLAAESLQTPSWPNAIRYLEQSTFGPNLAAISHVQAVGITNAINEELAYPAGVYTGVNADMVNNIPARDPAIDIFEHAITGQDQLRQRVAIALSQIFVVSLSTIPDNAAVADYLSMLRADAFGNFEALVTDVTLHPVMGRYLNMGNNVAYSTAATPTLIKPDENYARELMQLFTIGLDQLNLDGTPKLTCAPGVTPCTEANGGKRIPNYSQETVENLAHALTGWTYNNAGTATCPGRGGKKGTYYGNPVKPLVACAINHDPAAKLLTNNFTTTDQASPETHLAEAIHNLCTNPSAAPFISKQLIQHLVTANPSPAYVQRVATKFAATAAASDQLGQVVRAILVDDEARGPVPPLAVQPKFGHLRPPILLITNPIRWLNGTIGVGTGATLNAWSGRMGQSFPRPPSVFSYYPPNYTVPNNPSLLGPEYALVNGATTLDRGNYLNALLFPFVTKNATLTPITGITLDFSAVPQDTGNMVDWIDTNILHGTMTATTKAVILDAISDVPQGSQKALALYLAFSSPEYQFER